MSERPSTRDLGPVRLGEQDQDVVIDATISAPIAAVWQHLRDPELIRRWHGWDYGDFEREIDFIYRAHAREGATPYVLELEGGPAPGSFDLGDRFVLEEQDGATVVRITRGPQGNDTDWAAMYDDITQGWVSFLAQLKFVLERSGDSARRTVFLSAGPGRATRDLLGVGELRPGGAYSLASSPGLELSGQVWFATGAQTGLTVDGYGPGLVVLADRAGDQPGRVASSMAIVSTYDLADAEFDRVQQTWQAWWAEHHESASAPDA